MKDQGDSRELMRILKEQACWANVCTEPGMVAFMASKAVSLLDEPFLSIEIHLSGGILKNALSAGLPHTDLKGPEVAAAAGAVSGSPDKGLTILGDLSREAVAEASDLVARGVVSVKWDAEHGGIYGKCIARSAHHTAEVVVSGSHTGIVEEKVDGSLVDGASRGVSPPGLSVLRAWTFDRLLEAVMAVPIEELGWLLEGAKSCSGLAQSGAALSELSDPSLTASPDRALAALSCPENLVIGAAGHAFRAIYARMSGAPWAVLTSAGSGNQGIMVSVPVLSLASGLGASDDKTTRALALAHGVNMLIKAYTGEVSASCGGASAGAGVAAATCWMLGGTMSQMAEAVTEVLASLCGMVCDGAKATCAIKGSSAVMTGILAGAGASIAKGELRDQGVVGKSIDETLERLERLTSLAFSQSDAILLELSGIEKVR